MTAVERLHQHVAAVEARGGVWTRADEKVAASIDAEITVLAKRIESLSQMDAAHSEHLRGKDRPR